MRTRVLLIGGLSLVLVGVFGAGYTLRDLARGITETPSHWWSTAPWIVIVLGSAFLCWRGSPTTDRRPPNRNELHRAAGRRNPATGPGSQQTVPTRSAATDARPGRYPDPPTTALIRTPQATSRSFHSSRITLGSLRGSEPCG